MALDLIKYLPPVISDIEEYRAIMNGQQKELEGLLKAADQACNEQFLETMGTFGVERWEGMLGIVPDKNETLESRKVTIMVRFAETLPFTLRGLHQTMTHICGHGGYTLTIHPGSYTLYVEVLEWETGVYTAVIGALKRMVPSNIAITAIMARYTEVKLCAASGITLYRQEMI